MKHAHYIFALVFSFVVSSGYLHAQEGNTQQRRRTPVATRGERKSDKAETGLPTLTVRAQELNQRLTQEVGNARWTRIIYRELDLMQEQNASLYYPTRPMNDMSNLFTRIFQLMGDNKIKAYEYLDGFEVFDEEYQINFKEMLDRFYILYEGVPVGRGDTSYVVNDSDIPSEQVKAFYVKEAWYFDQNNSVFDVKTLAICPILTSDGDMGETRMPMFWLPYENIRPYINSAYIMTSNTNNAMTYTMDDFFRRRMFKGDIVKTQNLMNRPLQAYCPTPDSLKNEQQRIEQQLVSFEETLWIKPDTLLLEEDGKKKPEAKKEEKESKKEEPKKVKETKAKPLKIKESSSSNGAIKSVRRRR